MSDTDTMEMNEAAAANDSNESSQEIDEVNVPEHSAAAADDDATEMNEEQPADDDNDEQAADDGEQPADDGEQPADDNDSETQEPEEEAEVEQELPAAVPSKSSKKPSGSKKTGAHQAPTKAKDPVRAAAKAAAPKPKPAKPAKGKASVRKAAKAAVPKPKPAIVKSAQSTAKRHKNAHKAGSAIKGITKPGICRLQYRAGVKRMSRDAHDELRSALCEYLGKVVGNAVAYTTYSDRTTVSTKHVLAALQTQNHPLYGYAH